LAQGFLVRLVPLRRLLPIIAVAGLVSYRHMRGLLLFYGEEPIVSTSADRSRRLM
jgi:hypothetical protein